MLSASPFRWWGLASAWGGFRGIDVGVASFPEIDVGVGRVPRD